MHIDFHFILMKWPRNDGDEDAAHITAFHIHPTRFGWHQFLFGFATGHFLFLTTGHITI
jgi:hypothetical protein